MFKSILAWFMPQILHLGGGSTSTSKFEPPDYTVQPWKDYLGNAQNIANNPGALSPYGGQTVADLSPTTQTGVQMLNDFGTQGTPERTATGQVVSNISQGAMNPYATMNDAYTGSTNQFQNSQNPYMGQNPYLDAMIQNSNKQIADQYRTGTAAQTDALFARGGGYGSSGYDDMVNRNQQQLLGSLQANTNNLLKGNYDQSAGLAESGLNRSSGLAESALNRGAGLTEAGLNRATQAWQSGQQNALGAGQLGLGQQGADQSAIMAMLQGGQIPQQYQQQLLDAAKGYYQQGQQVPFTLSDYFKNALSAASGTGSTNTVTGPGQSGLLGGAGLAALLYGQGL